MSVSKSLKLLVLSIAFLLTETCLSFASETLNSVIFTGNTKVSVKDLQKTVRPFLHKDISAKTLNDLKIAVTRLYTSKGYSLSRAVIPPQDIQNGVVKVQVIEGKYNKITVHNKSRVSDKLIDATVANLKPGDVFNYNTLDTDMSLLRAMPGTSVTSFLSPGSIPGTTDTTVNVDRTPMLNANIGINDYGMAYTGQLMLTVDGSLNNIFHEGDTFSIVNAASSLGFNTAMVSYDTILNRYGTHVGASYGATEYNVGTGINVFSQGINASAAAALGASGYSQIASLWVTQPIIKRQNTDLTSRLDADKYFLSDTYNQSAGAVDDRTITALTGSLMYTGTGTTGVTTANLAYEWYTLQLTGGNPSLNPFGLTTPGTRDIWKTDVTRTQQLPGDGNSLFFNLGGMFSNGQLDPAMEYTLGGESNLRGYAMAVLFGDSGYDMNAEFRHVVQSVHTGQLMLTAFFDDAGVSLNNVSWLNLMSPGVGANYTYGKWKGNVEVGTPVGNVPSIVGGYSPVQVWFSLSRSFSAF